MSTPAPPAHSTPAISVVMPVHNGERFVGEAIASVCAQTFADLELIVVDDGSTDRTPAVLEEAARADHRLRVHRLERNLGITSALNEGCRLARANLIARMDADDVCVPERLERQVAFLGAHPEVAVVGCWVQRIDEQGLAGAVQRYPISPAMVAWSMFFFNGLAHPTVVMRRDALDPAAVYTDAYPRAEDYALFARLTRSHPLANLPEVLLRYRMWGGNSSRHDRQEHEAARVVVDHAKAIGVSLTEDDAHRLQGLARDRYPDTPAGAQRLARQIVALRDALVRQLPAGSGIGEVDRDAGVRIWLLAALAGRRAPLAGAGLALQALRLSPASLGTFLGKVVGRLRG
jgi:Glycosyl transferase family 2